MQFESKIGKMENVSLMVGNANGLIFNIAPMKYADHPQSFMQVITSGGDFGVPIASLFYTVNNTQQKLDFALPILHHKFIGNIRSYI